MHLEPVRFLKIQYRLQVCNYNRPQLSVSTELTVPSLQDGRR